MGGKTVESEIDAIANEDAKMIVDSPKDGEEVPRSEEKEEGNRRNGLEGSRRTIGRMDMDMNKIGNEMGDLEESGVMEQNEYETVMYMEEFRMENLGRLVKWKIKRTKEKIGMLRIGGEEELKDKLAFWENQVEFTEKIIEMSEKSSSERLETLKE